MPSANTSFRLWLRPTGSSEVSKAPRPDSDSSARRSFPKCKGSAFHELWRNRGLGSSCFLFDHDSSGKQTRSHPVCHVFTLLLAVPMAWRVHGFALPPALVTAGRHPSPAPLTSA